MSGESGEEGAGAWAFEFVASDPLRGLDAVEREAGHAQGMAGKAEERAEGVDGEVVPMLSIGSGEIGSREIGTQEGIEEGAPAAAIHAEDAVSGGEIALEYDCAVVEGMSERRVAMNPFKTVLGEGERLEERRGDGHGKDGRSEVVLKAGEGQGQGTGSAAGLGLGFVYVDSDASLREDDGGGEAVGTGSDDDGAGHETSSNRAAAVSIRTQKAWASVEMPGRSKLGAPQAPWMKPSASILA